MLLGCLVVLAGGCGPSHAELDAALVKAVGEGDLAKTRELLSQGANPNARDPNPARGFSVLISSLEHLDILDVLLAHGADPNLKDANGLSPLSYAVGLASETGPEPFKRLVAAGARLDERGQSGETILHYAANGGDLEIVKFLVNQGLDVNAKDNRGMTPLMHSVFSSGLPKDKAPIEIVRLLIDLGADLDAKDAKGQTAYDWAATGLFKGRSGEGELLSLLRPSAGG
ncbi:MAG: ankyrin repeat domain-containing protein [Fimbriimonadaceae bacterium]|nr:ankyrin repeat domain-containing protein [Fimbriimonadaceae bacterium]